MNKYDVFGTMPTFLIRDGGNVVTQMQLQKLAYGITRDQAIEVAREASRWSYAGGLMRITPFVRGIDPDGNLIETGRWTNGKLVWAENKE
jgi:hypothetical protein